MTDTATNTDAPPVDTPCWVRFAGRSTWMIAVYSTLGGVLTEPAWVELSALGAARTLDVADWRPIPRPDHG